MNEVRKIRIDFALQNLQLEVNHIMNLLSIYDEHFSEKQVRNNSIMERARTNISDIRRLCEL